jgi:phosphoglycolate phosphatase-like HAD superfamily hydrolase
MIGDSIIDIQTGKNAEVTAVACLWGFNTHEELAPAQPDFFIKTPQQLLSL